MKNYKLLIYTIILILFKTGNVLSSESIFTVNNIQINKNDYKNKDELINIAFRKGFEKLNNKILLQSDYEKIKSTNLQSIKNLVSHYQIMESNLTDTDETILINIFFKRDKMYNFYTKNNIKYSDVSGKSIEILPILIFEDEIYIYDNNYFFKNWLKEEKNQNDEKKLIEYILPLESLEIIQQIKINQNNLEMIDLNYLFDQIKEKDSLFIAIDYKKKQTKIFLKGFISSKPIVKNVAFTNTSSTKENNYPEILNFLKKQIVEITKSQNVIDIGRPAFLKMKLLFYKQDDLFKFQKILSKIDLIEKSSIDEFNSQYALIKIKYFGKINIIKEKLTQNGLILELKDNEISARIK